MSDNIILSGDKYIWKKDDYIEVNYELVDEDDYVERIHMVLPKDNETRIHGAVYTDNGSKFVNGFRLVQNEYGQNLYVREEDNKVMPHVFDIAGNFNEYGYAKVGKNGRVSWIDKNFNYLNKEGKMVPDDINDYNFDGWTKVYPFSKGNTPLSKCLDMNVSYFGIDGNVKEFKRYSASGKLSEEGLTSFNRFATTFNSKGYAISPEGFMDKIMIFDKGYYITYEDLLLLSMENGLFNSVIDKADECMEKVYKKD